MNIAIDGPAGAGKSTIAKAVAKELGITYVDTGAMYRAIGLYVLRAGIPADDRERVEASLDGIDIMVDYVDGVQKVTLNGEDVTEELRQEAVGNMASAVSVHPGVRTKLVDMQRAIAAAKDVVMDGRDIGTVVLPDADVKIYLTASVECRANRRYRELIEKGEEADMAEIARTIVERDERDMNRETSPLRQADDAKLIDSSDMTIAEVVSEIMHLVHR